MNNEEKFYAKKVPKESSNLFEKEINILNTLKSANNQNIVNIISSGEGLFNILYMNILPKMKFSIIFIELNVV